MFCNKQRNNTILIIKDILHKVFSQLSLVSILPLRRRFGQFGCTVQGHLDGNTRRVLAIRPTQMFQLQ